MNKVLGVNINCIDLISLRELLKDWLKESGQKKIYTPNPEMLVQAYNDAYFKKVLNLSDINICDGRGVELALKGRCIRIAGVDLVLEICSICSQLDKKIFLLGTLNDDVLRQTANKLKKLYSNIEIVGLDKGPVIKQSKNGTLEIDQSENQALIGKINKLNTDVLFVAFGHGKQEKWIHENLSKLPNIKIAMGVGGSLEYISGKITRAPKYVRLVGLEWLYRLVRQPWRIKRIWRATMTYLRLLNRDRHSKS